MNKEVVEKLANADVEQTAVEAYNTMNDFEEGEDHARACIKNVLMPMIAIHVEMAQALLAVHEALE